MTKTTLIYVWSVVAVGTAIIAASGLLWQGTNGPAFWLCLGLAALASTFKVKLPGFDSSISPAFVFQLVAAAQFSGPETVAIGVVSALVQSLWKRENRPAFMQVAFNAATLAISSGIAFDLAQETQGETGAGEHTLMLGIAGLVLLVVNTLMVSTVLCLLQSTPIRAAWRSIQLWALPYYLAGGVLASVWVHAAKEPSLYLSVLAAMSVYVLSVCYRQGVERVSVLVPARG